MATNYPEAEAYSRSVEENYRRLLESTPGVDNVWKATVQQDMADHFDVGVVMNDDYVWRDDVKTVFETNNRHGGATKYVVSTHMVDHLKTLPPNRLAHRRLVLEEYAGVEPTGRYVRYSCLDAVRSFDSCFTYKTGSTNDFWLFDPVAADAAGVTHDVFQSDVPM